MLQTLRRYSIAINSELESTANPKVGGSDVSSLRFSWAWCLNIRVYIHGEVPQLSRVNITSPRRIKLVVPQIQRPSN